MGETPVRSQLRRSRRAALIAAGAAALLTLGVVSPASADPARASQGVEDRTAAQIAALQEIKRSLSGAEYARIARTDPSVLVGATGDAPSGPDAVRTLARGRAVVDFVASLTDNQAAALLDGLSGRTGQLWTDAFVL